MSSWRSARFLASSLLFFAVAALAGTAPAQATGAPPPGTTDPDRPNADAQAPAPSSSASQPSASRPVAPQPSEPARYNTTPALRRDLAVSAFAQISGSKVGNFIRNDTTGSGGALLSYRYTYKPWLAYEANYGYTRFTDSYYYGQILVPHNTHEFSIAYLLQGPKFSGVTPFLTLGGGALVFAPTNTGSSSGAYSADAKKMFVYGIGLQHAVVSDRWGVRVQYRGLKYGIPDFGQLNLNTHRSRNTSEPAVGLFYRF